MSPEILQVQYRSLRCSKVNPCRSPGWTPTLNTLLSCCAAADGRRQSIEQSASRYNSLEITWMPLSSQISPEWTMCNEILTWHVVYCVRMLVWNPHSRNHHKLPRTCEAVPKVPATKPCNPTYPHWKKYSFLRICLRGIQICAPRVQYALQIPDIWSIPPSQRQH